MIHWAKEPYIRRNININKFKLYVFLDKLCIILIIYIGVKGIFLEISVHFVGRYEGEPMGRIYFRVDTAPLSKIGEINETFV